jgi:hypothetical protein
MDLDNVKSNTQPSILGMPSLANIKVNLHAGNFIVIWFQNMENSQTVAAGFDPCYFSTYEDLPKAVTYAIRQIETGQEYPDEEEAVEEEADDPTPAAASAAVATESAPVASNAISSTTSIAATKAEAETVSPAPKSNA